MGAGDDCLSQYSSLLPLAKSIESFDINDGDAQYLSTLRTVPYDFLYSSHCLEHLVDPWVALADWVKCVKKGGHLVVVVPDEDMYEQGVWPSKFNGDHKHTFTMYKPDGVSWSPVSVNVLDLVSYVADEAECVAVQRLESTYLHSLPTSDRRFGMDQTLGIGECGIEFVLRKYK